LEELEEAYLDTLIVASKPKVIIEPEIFKTVFDAWSKHCAIDVTYINAKGESSQRRIEPHVIAYNEYIWYIKGEWSPLGETKRQADINKDTPGYIDDKYRVFAIHRITQAEFATNSNGMQLSYDRDQVLITSVEENGLFNYPRIHDVKLRCNQNARGHILEQADAKGHVIEKLPNGELHITIPSVIEYDLINWVLTERGNVEVLEPQALREKVKDEIAKLSECYK